MRPTPRPLILTALTLLIFFAWVASGLFWAQIPIRSGKSLNCIDISIGRIWVVHYTINPPTQKTFIHRATRTPREDWYWSFIADVGESGWRLLPTFQHDRPGTPLAIYGNTLTFHWQLGLPLYPFFLATGIPAALMWRSWFRARRDAGKGHCPRCGYDTRGLQSPCPECGSTQQRASGV